MRFVSFSRGAFETTSLQRKDREWGKRPTNKLFLLGTVLAIGGVIGGFKCWTNIGYAFGGSGNGSGVISPLSRVEGSEQAGDNKGVEKEGALGETEEGTGGSFETGTKGQIDGEVDGDTKGKGGNSEESSQGSQRFGEDGEGNSEEESGQLREVGQTNERTKEKIQAYLEEKGSELAGSNLDFLYQEELNVGLSGLSRLVVSIAGAESNFGKVCPLHNAWGIKCGSNTYCRYSSWEEGIKAITTLLRQPFYGLGERVTEEDIWRIAPTYAESSRWPYDVAWFWNELKD